LGGIRAEPCDRAAAAAAEAYVCRLRVCSCGAVVSTRLAV